MFIGREYELNFLNERYASDKAEFIVLYGRRRVGKTELLTEFCKNKPCVFYTCNEYTNEKQLKEFSNKLLPTNPKLAKLYKQFFDWDSAFNFIGEYEGSQKMVIVIDEFPYMVKGDNSIPSVIQSIWDLNLKNKNIMLILSGSSMSFIEKELLAYKNPLFGRTTGIYKLEPLPYYDAVKFFPSWTNEEKAIAYAILGGIPHYLKQFLNSLSLEENIKKNILNKSAQLYEEVEFLLHQEMREPAVYITIIEAIALGANKYSEICEKTAIENSKLSAYLKNLMELGIIIKELPALSKTKDTIKKSSGEYVLADNYFKFFYKYVYPYKSELDTNNIDIVWNYCIKNDLHDFTSRTFEKICIRYLYLLLQKHQLPIFFSGFNRWWGKVTKADENGKMKTTSEEIDIVAADKIEENYLVGECKFKNELFGIKEYKHLVSKVPFKGNIYYYLFSLSGFTKGLIEEANINQNIKLISLDDIIAFTI